MNRSMFTYAKDKQAVCDDKSYSEEWLFCLGIKQVNSHRVISQPATKSKGRISIQKGAVRYTRKDTRVHSTHEVGGPFLRF